LKFFFFPPATHITLTNTMEQADYQQARKGLVTYVAAAHSKIPVTLNRSTNIFFRQMRMVKHTAGFLGPSTLETDLRNLYRNIEWFYHSHRERNEYLFYKIPYLTFAYMCLSERVIWFLKNLEVCYRNIDLIDERKDVIPPLTRDIPTLIPKYAFMIGEYELQLFASLQTNVIDKTSILQFLRHINEALTTQYTGPIIYEIMKAMELKLNLVTAFLRFNYTLPEHQEKPNYVIL